MAETSETGDHHMEHHHQKNPSDFHAESSYREQEDQDTQVQSNPQAESPVRPHTQANGSRGNKRKNKLSSPESDRHHQSADHPPEIDELTAYAMAKEGIELKDLQHVPYEQFLEECNGNEKLARIRYEFKESERQGLIQDIENRKQMLQMELHPMFQFAGMTTSPPHGKLYSTQQPLANSRFNRTAQSHSSLPTSQLAMSNGLRNMKGDSKGKKDVDNKIFENMLKNQIEQELKLKSIKERQEHFLQKEQEMLEKRNREIQRKQEYMHQKQLMKEEKLRKQEQAMKELQEQTLKKLQLKSEISEQRQLKMKLEVKQKLHQKEEKHEIKRKYAQDMFMHQIQTLESKQQEVKKKESIFQKKQQDKQRQLEQYINYKKQKKEQILRTVQEQKEYEDQKRLEKFMTAQQIEQEKEQRLQEQKRRQQLLKQRLGKEKNDRMQYKIEEAYRKMEEWTKELERREKAAEDNLKQQQRIIQEKLAMKREMYRLKQESAQLKQKRKENKERLKKEEQTQKLENLSEKMNQFKMNQLREKQEKQQALFKAEQKRADMKTAFYHMAVWNVQEAGDIIGEILEENDHKKSQTAVKPISVAEKVRKKAAMMRKCERMGLNSRMIQGVDKIEEHSQGEYEGEQQTQFYNSEVRQQESELPKKNHKRNKSQIDNTEDRQMQKVVYDERVNQENL